MSERPPLRLVKPAPGPKCPVCSKPGGAKYKPFCSSRCADIDLGRWLKESYRVPGAPQQRDEEDDS
jgi:endogenous inhibitor of DNA gyrase (YacG/DUF329 family)